LRLQQRIISLHLLIYSFEMHLQKDPNASTLTRYVISSQRELLTEIMARHTLSMWRHVPLPRVGADESYNTSTIQARYGDAQHVYVRYN
jgi:hypothetical protein